MEVDQEIEEEPETETLPLQDQEQPEDQTGAAMTEDAQQVRRSSIRSILADDGLSAVEKRRSIQYLMDGRRRSSSGGSVCSGGSVGGGSTGVTSRGSSVAQYYAGSDHEGGDDMDQQGPPTEVHLARNPDGSDTATTSSVHSSSASIDLASGEQQDQTFATRKQRSSSMPLWSDSGVNAVAPIVAASSNVWDDPLNVNIRMEKSRPQCGHYERNCTIISPCCGLAFGCRICHDDCPVLPIPTQTKDSSQQQEKVQMPWAGNVEGINKRQEKRRSMPLAFDEEETHHEIDRFAIAEVICRLCYTRQSSKTNHCNTCGAQFGAYHCDICNLWMSADESPYHCSDCGFCRVGGRENFRHCDDCGMCIDTLLFDDHNCKAGKYMSNCPVCQEDLFSSRDASHEMPCGHAIHWHCFKELTSYDTRCPVCKKTAETPEHMAPTWQAMAMGIALQPVPPELARVVTVTCVDCETRDEDRRWHFLGVRCLNCMSFNTTVDRTTLTGREAAAYLDARDGNSIQGEEFIGPRHSSEENG